jgi:cation transport regulator ChaC
MVEMSGVVEGKVYRIGQEALKYLLEREGVQNYYYRPAFVDICVGNKEVKDVLTFLVIDKTQEEVAPPEKYLAEIRRGGKTVWSTEYEKRFEEEIEQKFIALT